MPRETPFDIPGIQYGEQLDYAKLYYSDHMAALRVPVTLKSGYGLVLSGQTLAADLSAGGNGLLVPYNPTVFPASIDPGRAYLVTDGAALGTTVYVTMDDSYKFAVGDDLIINDNTTTAENLGAITAIDRASATHRAMISFTTAIGATAFTAARYAYIAVEAGTANNFSDAVGILEKTVNTGIGSKSKGAVSTLILGNCVLYRGMLVNLDTVALAALSGATFGQYTYIR